MKKLLIPVLLVFSLPLFAQYNVNLPANHWVDSVFNTLTDTQKIAQLMVVRLSSIDGPTGKITFYDSQVVADIQRYNIGGICLFQGGPKQQAAFINHFQSIAKTPILGFHRCRERIGYADARQCRPASAADDAGRRSGSAGDLQLWKNGSRTVQTHGHTGGLCPGGGCE